MNSQQKQQRPIASHNSRCNRSRSPTRDGRTKTAVDINTPKNKNMHTIVNMLLRKEDPNCKQMLTVSDHSVIACEMYNLKMDERERRAKELLGIYVAVGQNHEKPCFKRITEGHDVLVYYWDTRDGLDMKGWWFGNEVGGMGVYGHCLTNKYQDSLLSPPVHGWRLPWDGPRSQLHVHMSLRCDDSSPLQANHEHMMKLLKVLPPSKIPDGYYKGFQRGEYEGEREGYEAGFRKWIPDQSEPLESDQSEPLESGLRKNKERHSPEYQQGYKQGYNQIYDQAYQRGEADGLEMKGEGLSESESLEEDGIALNMEEL